MFPYWRPWLRDVASRAWRNVRQTAGPILLVAYQTGQLTGTSSARALAAGVLTAVAVTTGRLLVGDLAGWQPSPTSPPWRATATRVVAAAAFPSPRSGPSTGPASTASTGAPLGGLPPSRPASPARPQQRPAEHRSGGHAGPGVRRRARRRPRRGRPHRRDRRGRHRTRLRASTHGVSPPSTGWGPPVRLGPDRRLQVVEITGLHDLSRGGTHMSEQPPPAPAPAPLEPGFVQPSAMPPWTPGAPTQPPPKARSRWKTPAIALASFVIGAGAAGAGTAGDNASSAKPTATVTVTAQAAAAPAPEASTTTTTEAAPPRTTCRSRRTSGSPCRSSASSASAARDATSRTGSTPSTSVRRRPRPGPDGHLPGRRRRVRPQINSFTIEDNTASYDQEEMISTKSSKSKLSVKVTQVLEN